MKILLLTQWYPPEPMKLLSDLAESLVAMGHEVTVLTGFPNWPSGKIYPGYRQRLVQRETVNGVRIIRLPLYPNHSRSALKRIANFLSFALSATILGPIVAPQVDVIYVIHPPITIGLPAWVISRLRGVAFTIEIQDMWPENLRSTGMLNNELALRIIGSFAHWVYAKAQSVRVISPGFRLNLLEKGVSDHKISVISNWVDTEYYRPVAKSLQIMNQFGLQRRFNILYAGTIGFAQGLEVILDAASLLRHSLPLAQFVLAGDGVELARLQTLASERELTNVRFLGRLPGESMPGLYACADVLMLHLRADPLFSITIPHKVFTYLAAGKPILLGGEGDAASLITEAGAGVVVPPGNPEQLARAVLNLHDLPATERDAMGNNGRRLACISYGRVQLVQRISTLVESAAT